jgi:hypothetical protein
MDINQQQIYVYGCALAVLDNLAEQIKNFASQLKPKRPWNQVSTRFWNQVLGNPKLMR